MVLPLGQHDGAQRIVKLTRGKDGVTRQDLIWVRFVPLAARPGARIVRFSCVGIIRVETPLGLKLYLLARCLTRSSVVAFE